MKLKAVRARGLGVVSLAVAGSLLAACTATDPAQQAGAATGASAVINVALGSDVDLLDPHMFRTDAAYVVTANVYEPLLRQK